MNYLTVFFLCIFALIASTSARRPPAKFHAKRDLNGRIIGGDTANAGQFPSAAAIYVTTSDGTYFCGGSLISRQWVLTAAHCISGGISFRVLLGSTTLQGADENRVTLSTSHYVIHPDFDPVTLQHDVGLIKFHMEVTYNDYIIAAHLPTTDLSDNTTNFALGWGSTSDESASLTNELNYVSVTSIPNSECQLSYSSTIFDSMVCVAGNFNEGACRGDSGSPLITVLVYLHWHTGIASFISTYGCETADPSGYTRTAPYVEWIKTTAEML